MRSAASRSARPARSARHRALAEGELDPGLLGPPGTPLRLRYEPVALAEIDPDEAWFIWGAEESWVVTPILRPLGYWRGE